MLGLHAHRIALHGRFGPADLQLAPGSLTMVIGPNGAGKTSLFHALIGYGDTAGNVMIADTPLSGMTPAIRMRRLAFMPASRDIAWPMRARDIVQLGLAPGLDALKVDHALARLDAASLASRPVNSLSTGERTRILIARAIVSQPDVVLLDEPLANLDPAWRLRVLEILAEEAARGAVVMLSVHDLLLARHHRDRVLLIDKGQIIADGQPAATMTETRLSSVFGVRLTDQGMELSE